MLVEPLRASQSTSEPTLQKGLGAGMLWDALGWRLLWDALSFSESLSHSLVWPQSLESFSWCGGGKRSRRVWWSHQRRPIVLPESFQIATVVGNSLELFFHPASRSSLVSEKEANGVLTGNLKGPHSPICIQQLALPMLRQSMEKDGRAWITLTLHHF